MLIFQTELPAMRKQLLSDFLPDDVCPLGAQFVETPGQVPPFGSKKDNSQEEVLNIYYSKWLVESSMT